MPLPKLAYFFYALGETGRASKHGSNQCYFVPGPWMHTRDPKIDTPPGASKWSHFFHFPPIISVLKRHRQKKVITFSFFNKNFWNFTKRKSRPRGVQKHLFWPSTHRSRDGQRQGPPQAQKNILTPFSRKRWGGAMFSKVDFAMGCVRMGRRACNLHIHA